MLRRAQHPTYYGCPWTAGTPATLNYRPSGSQPLRFAKHENCSCLPSCLPSRLPACLLPSPPAGPGAAWTKGSACLRRPPPLPVARVPGSTPAMILRHSPLPVQQGPPHQGCHPALLTGGRARGAFQPTHAHPDACPPPMAWRASDGGACTRSQSPSCASARARCCAPGLYGADAITCQGAAMRSAPAPRQEGARPPCPPPCVFD
jgi:hypothetical protein